MRDGETGCVDDLITVGEDVEIEGPGAPSPIANTAGHPLDLEKTFEKVVWSDIGVESNNSVEVVILVGTTHRSRLVDRGTRGDDAEVCQAANSLGEMVEPITDIRPDANVRSRHRLPIRRG